MIVELTEQYQELTLEEKHNYFCELGNRLLEHRYRYYGMDDPVISDFEYDYLESYYEAIARDLQLEPVASSMVDFDYKREDAEQAASRVTLGLDYYSLWIDQMIPIWRRIGPPKKLKDSLSNDG